MSVPKEKTNLAVAEEPTANLANQEELLGFFGENAQDGRENIKSDDVSIPRLAILQPTSPQTQDREAKAFAGDIYDVLNKVNYGNKGLKFIPLYFFGTRTKWLNPKEINSPIECIARDGEHGSKYGKCISCRFTQWTEAEDSKGNMVPEGPGCTEFKNILLIPLPDGQDYRHMSPIVYSAKRTAIQPIKNMLTQVQQFKFKGMAVPMYARMWELTVVQKTNDAGTYYVPQFDGLDVILDMEMLRYFKSVYGTMKEIQSKFDIAQENDGSGGGGGEVVDAKFTPRDDI